MSNNNDTDPYTVVPAPPGADNGRLLRFTSGRSDKFYRVNVFEGHDVDRPAVMTYLVLRDWGRWTTLPHRTPGSDFKQWAAYPSLVMATYDANCLIASKVRKGYQAGGHGFVGQVAFDINCLRGVGRDEVRDIRDIHGNVVGRARFSDHDGRPDFHDVAEPTFPELETSADLDAIEIERAPRVIFVPRRRGRGIGGL